MKRSILVAMSAMLAGCSGFPDLGLWQDGAAKPAPATPAAGPAEHPSASQTALAKPVPRPKRKPSHIGGIEPDLLIGRTPGEVEALIGRPTTMADRPPATVWQYNTDQCALTVFFYMDVGSKTFRALTFDTKGANGVAASPAHCLGHIRAVADGS